MNLVTTPITGRETPADADSPFAALVGFYKAFNSRDIHLMARNWHDGPEASLCNPVGGGVRRGWEQIAQLYEGLFNGRARVYVEYYDYSVHEHGRLFFAVGRERGTFAVGDTKIDLDIRTSRTFLGTDGGWRQLHHHGSIENADLLERYQRAVAMSR